MNFSKENHEIQQKRITMRKTTILKTLVLFFLITTFFSCGNDDDPILNVNYGLTVIEAVFFEAGNSNAPTTVWNGNEGTFSLAIALNGLSINENTGILSWTKALPQGVHTIEVVTTNNTGQISTNITLNNKLQGVFLYNFENDCFKELIFNEDGTLDVRYIGAVDIIANGSWEISTNEVVGSYTFTDGSGDQGSIKGILTNNTTAAILIGSWYDGLGAIAGQEQGSINLRIEQLPAGDGIITQLDNGSYIIALYGGCGGACCLDTIAAAQSTFPGLTLTYFP